MGGYFEALRRGAAPADRHRRPGGGHAPAERTGRFPDPADPGQRGRVLPLRGAHGPRLRRERPRGRHERRGRHLLRRLPPLPDPPGARRAPGFGYGRAGGDAGLREPRGGADLLQSRGDPRDAAAGGRGEVPRRARPAGAQRRGASGAQLRRAAAAVPGPLPRGRAGLRLLPEHAPPLRGRAQGAPARAGRPAHEPSRLVPLQQADGDDALRGRLRRKSEGRAGEAGLSPGLRRELSPSHAPFKNLRDQGQERRRLRRGGLPRRPSASRHHGGSGGAGGRLP